MSHDFEVFVAGEAEQLQLYVLASPDSRRLIYPLIWLHDPPFTDLYLHDPSTGKPPQRIVEKMEGMFCPYFFLERQLITLTDWRAPNGRVLAIDMDSPHPNNWRDLVPESRSPIQGIAVVGARIFVRYIEKLQTRIEIFDQLGRRQGILPCQSDSTARFLGGRPESDTLFYEVTSFSRPPSIVTYHTTSGKQEIWANQEVPFDSSSVEVNQVSYPSKDGTQIPMFLICQKERGSRQLPTFLTGYGGFGASITPQFAAYAAFLIEHGFLFAVANLRGGAEFGRQWHLAGRRHNRQNAIDDFIAAAEWLLSTGHTDLEGLAIGGGSNAGLLVGAALTQRPDLFRAVICLGPLLDMLRYHKFDMAQRWVEEFGSTDDPDDFRALRAYSPYHNVRAGIAYPAAMLITGDADSRCHPMHARKMTAALQAATSSQRTVLLDYRRTWGHVAVQPLTARIEALTDRLAFICQELGVTV